MSASLPGFGCVFEESHLSTAYVTENYENLDDVVDKCDSKSWQGRVLEKWLIWSPLVCYTCIVCSRTARNLGVVIDDQLNFPDHVASTTRYCSFIFYNIRKIRPFLSEYATQVLVQTGILQCTTGWTPSLHNQTFTDDPEYSSKSSLQFTEETTRHSSPLSHIGIKFKALLLAYKTTTGSAPAYLHPLIQIYIPARSLCSANKLRLVVPSKKRKITLMYFLWIRSTFV